MCDVDQLADNEIECLRAACNQTVRRGRLKTMCAVKALPANVQQEAVLSRDHSITLKMLVIVSSTYSDGDRVRAHATFVDMRVVGFTTATPEQCSTNEKIEQNHDDKQKQELSSVSEPFMLRSSTAVRHLGRCHSEPTKVHP
jgi:hypothetical protein